MQKKLCTPEKNAKKFAPQKNAKFCTPWKYAKNLHNYPNSNKTLTKPYKNQRPKNSRATPYEPEKAFEFPLKFPYKINTFQRLAINNPHQIVNKNKGPKKLGKNHLWTNSFTPWNFSPVFSANGSWIAQGYPIIFSNKCAETLFQEVLKHPEIRFREHGPPSKNAKKCKHKG